MKCFPATRRSRQNDRLENPGREEARKGQSGDRTAARVESVRSGSKKQPSGRRPPASPDGEPPRPLPERQRIPRVLSDGEGTRTQVRVPREAPERPGSRIRTRRVVRAGRGAAGTGTDRSRPPMKNREGRREWSPRAPDEEVSGPGPAPGCRRRWDQPTAREEKNMRNRAQNMRRKGKEGPSGVRASERKTGSSGGVSDARIRSPVDCSWKAGRNMSARPDFAQRSAGREVHALWMRQGGARGAGSGRGGTTRGRKGENRNEPHTEYARKAKEWRFWRLDGRERIRELRGKTFSSRPVRAAGRFHRGGDCPAG